MGFLNFLQEILDPGVVSEYNNLKNYHREALDNWLRGGYRPRCIIPQNERTPFNNYDQEWNYINSMTSKNNRWVDVDNMSYEQKQFIVGRKQQILSLYSTFQKYEAIAAKVAKLASDFPFGFNAVAIKYGNFRVKGLFYEYDIDYFNSDPGKWNNYILRDLSHFQAKEVESVYQISYEQGNAILTHLAELRSENSRLSKRDSEEKEKERIKKEKEIIDRASFIARCNPYAYKMMINYPLDNLSLSRAKEIIEKEGTLKAKEQNHREEELTRKRKEYEKKNLSTLLPACVSSWETHSNSSMKHKYFFEYYPYSSYKDNATGSMRDTWRTVWHFKNDPDKNVTTYEHKSALQTVTNLVEKALRSAFGSKTEYLTLVCLTASTQRKTELRYKDFAEQLCKSLNMNNAFPHIQVIEGGSAKHDGGDGSRRVSYDRYFFNGKYVVLFDDVRTTGHSLEQERHTMEELGAKVICAITIAQTKY